MIKDVLNYIGVLVTAVIATAALYDGRFDPLYVVIAIVLAAFIGVLLTYWRLREVCQRKQNATHIQGLSDEHLENLEKEARERRNRQIVFSVAPIVVLILVVLAVVSLARDYAFRPLDSIGFATLGGDVAYDALDARPHWYYPCADLSSANDPGQANLQLVYTYGHGAAFQLVKRPSVSDAVITGFRVKISSLVAPPKIYIPPGGAAVVLPYVLVADIPPNAAVGTEWPATYYRRDLAKDRLEEVPCVFRLEEASDFFEVRVNCQAEVAMKFKVLADVSAGWRSDVVEVGESDECLFLSAATIESAGNAAAPPGFHQMFQWMNMHRGQDRGYLAKSWADADFGAAHWPKTDSTGAALGDEPVAPFPAAPAPK